MSTRARVIEFLGLRRSIVGLLALVVLVGLGERMGERFLPIYLLALGGGAWSIGVLQALTNLLGALYSYPGGLLADRIGAGRALLLFTIVAVTGFLLIALVPAWPAVIAGAFLFLSWSAVTLPGMMSLVSTALPKDKRTMGVTVHSLVRRIPMAAGPVLGGALIYLWGERDGTRLAFVGAAAAGVLALVAHRRLIDPAAAPASPAFPPSVNPLRMLPAIRGELRDLLVCDILIRFCEQIPYAFVVVWCMHTIAQPVSAVEFGALTAIEMAAAVLCYLPVAYFADRTNKRPFVAATFVFFTLFPLVLLMCDSFWTLAGAFTLRGLKEFGEPTRKALILDLCPDDHRATAFGCYYLVRDTVVSIAALLGAGLWSVSPRINLLAAGAFGALGTAFFIARSRRESSEKSTSANVTAAER